MDSPQAVIARDRVALKLTSHEGAPQKWAEIQLDMGNALFALGEGDTNADSLNGALAAYRDALKELTREGAPLLWAKAQNNLGNTLSRSGKPITRTFLC
jgi:hypothetical protein